MTLSTDLQIAIAVRRVDESMRVDVLPRHFGRHMIRVESAVFDWARRLSTQYRGGFWHFFEFGEGGFFMAPETEPFLVVVSGNGFEGHLGAQAFGITCCLFAFSHLSFHIADDSFVRHYQLLWDLAIEHPEAGAIAAAID